MLVTSICSISHNVFINPLPQGVYDSGLTEKGLKLFPFVSFYHTIPIFSIDPDEENL